MLCSAGESRGDLTGAGHTRRDAASDSDSSDHLIVDESKRPRPQMKPGSLKMRLPGKRNASTLFINCGLYL